MTAAPHPTDNANNAWLAAFGGTLLLLGHRRRGIVGTLAGVTGAGIIARAAAPFAAMVLRHAGLARQAVRLTTSVVVDRPVREMFALCSNFENFPRFVAALRGVTDFDDGRSRWTVTTASGETLEWDVMVTKYVPGQVIAWESAPNSPVESTGIVRFTPEGADKTRLDITIRYKPVYTSLRDAVRSIVGPPRTPAVRRAMATASNRLSDIAGPTTLAEASTPA